MRKVRAILRKRLQKLNLIQFGVTLIILFFFIQTLIFTWKYATPYCRADDWRSIRLYLMPYYDGTLSFTDLWSDPVHPMPGYAFLFVLSARLENLQIHHIARASIFFQLLLGFLIINSLKRSFNQRKIKRKQLLFYLVGICTIVFTFNQSTTYIWPAVTFSFIMLFFIFLSLKQVDLYWRKSVAGNRQLLLVSFFMLIATVLFSDHSAIFGAAIVTVLIIISIFERKVRRKSILLFLVVTFSIIAGFILLGFMIGTNTITQKINFAQFVSLFTSHLFTTIKALGVGLFSGIADVQLFKYRNQELPMYYIIASLIFMAAYFLVLITFLYKRLHYKSLWPPVMMLFALIFQLSVFAFRYNPIEYGVSTLAWPRYYVIFQIGIVGLLWAVFLLFESLKCQSRVSCRNQNTIVISFVGLMLVKWGILYFHSCKKAEFVRSKNAEVSEKIRTALDTQDYTIPFSNHSGRNISDQLEFMKKHKLNIFALNYPYPDFNSSNENAPD